jgi:hypothetical protein
LVSRMSKPVPFAELPGPSANRVLSG